MFCARRDGRRVSYGFRDNGVDRVDPILRARHRFSGARSAQALADLNRATLFFVSESHRTIGSLPHYTARLSSYSRNGG